MKLGLIFSEYKGEDIEIKGLSTNSKEVKPGDLFICIKGAKIDRHDFIDEAIANGAIALVTEKDVETSVPYIKLDNVNDNLANIYQKFYDNPQDKLTLIGVTGTDGKTSTTTIVQKLLGNDICGYIGTNGYSCLKFNRETNNTTPGIEAMYRILNEFVEAGCKYVAMETSSEAFFYGRLKSFSFEIGAITNIDSEHLNTHKTLENYIECKKMLFKQSNLSVFNSNDKYFESCNKVANNYKTYGYNKNDDLYIKEYTVKPNGTDITYVYDKKEYKINSPMLGIFNIENLACALLISVNLGFNIEDIIKNISAIKVDGRMESLNLGQNFYCLVDYAHTPNGLNRLFEFTNKLNVNKRIVVTGNAGERDASKRKYVGKICVDNNDLVIFCYEDPRFEDPMNVIKDLTELCKDSPKYQIIVDRKTAIEKAIEIADENDLVMILGKGNEDYELIKGEEVPFNDINEATIAIKNKLKKDTI